jgi:hypothetical protein
MIAFCIHGVFHNEEYLELMLVMCGMNATLHAAVRREAWHRHLQSAVAVVKERAHPARRSKARKKPVRQLGLMFEPSRPRNVAFAGSH